MNVVVLGSTGSIGINTLDVISRQAGQYSIFALSANNNIAKIYAQCLKYKPKFAVLNQVDAAKTLASKLAQASNKTQVLHGARALCDMASHDDVDIVMAAIVGAAGLRSTFSAIDAGKKVLIANKEPIVMAGDLMLKSARLSGARILPVDSEHNAIMQCLPDSFDVVQNRLVQGISRILLTGSGGPFRNTPLDHFESITPKQACAHPNWVMGPKISIDSATMMNKALELIEAGILFNVDQSKIEIVIHPQSIIHSMVEYIDGSVMAQMASPDMRTPIANALAWPRRIESGTQKLDFTKLTELDFHAPDELRYPSLRIVREVIASGGTAPCVMNGANEIAVDAFLKSKIKFKNILDLVERALGQSNFESRLSLESVLAADQASRAITNQLVKRYST